MINERTLCFVVRGNPPEDVLLGLKKARFGAGKILGFGGGVEPGETIRQAAVRELEEEAGLQTSEADLLFMGHVWFIFPAKPAWDQKVYIFRTSNWTGTHTETEEMRPIWFPIRQLPFQQMWQDAPHWLPQVLAGQRIYKRFVYAVDNESIQAISDDDEHSTA